MNKYKHLIKPLIIGTIIDFSTAIIAGLIFGIIYGIFLGVFNPEIFKYGSQGILNSTQDNKILLYITHLFPIIGTICGMSYVIKKVKKTERIMATVIYGLIGIIIALIQAETFFAKGLEIAFMSIFSYLLTIFVVLGISTLFSVENKNTIMGHE